MAPDRSDDVLIAIEGPATIYEAKALRQTLLQGLIKEGTIHIDLADSGKWDLAGLQLLISIIRTARNQGRTARLHRVTRICAEVAERSGLTDWLRSVSE